MPMKSIKRFGYGTAMAQVYHHSILPLCDLEDKSRSCLGNWTFEIATEENEGFGWLKQLLMSEFEVLADYGIVFKF